MRNLMRNVVCPLAILACLAAAATGARAAPDYARLDWQLHEAAGDQEAMCAAIRKLSRELSNSPDDAELLRMRVNAYRAVGDFFAAKKDSAKLARMFPGFTPYRMLDCMLLESTGAAEEDYLACYRGVLSSFGSESLREKDPNGHILVLLLAKAPEAEAMRRRYSQALTSDNNYNVTREQLMQFNRRAIVPRIEPGMPRPNPCGR